MNTVCEPASRFVRVLFPGMTADIISGNFQDHNRVGLVRCRLMKWLEALSYLLTNIRHLVGEKFSSYTCFVLLHVLRSCWFVWTRIINFWSSATLLWCLYAGVGVVQWILIQYDCIYGHKSAAKLCKVRWNCSTIAVPSTELNNATNLSYEMESSNKQLSTWRTVLSLPLSWAFLTRILQESPHLRQLTNAWSHFPTDPRRSLEINSLSKANDFESDVNYSTIEKESFSVLWAIAKFRPYIYGNSLAA